ncbi:hypothetical protein D3C72_2566500 [compost metagenome]
MSDVFYEASIGGKLSDKAVITDEYWGEYVTRAIERVVACNACDNRTAAYAIC